MRLFHRQFKVVDKRFDGGISGSNVLDYLAWSLVFRSWSGLHYSNVHAHIVVLQFVAQSGEDFGGILVENALLHLADAYFEGIGRDESGLHHSHSADEHTAVRVVADKVVPSRSEHGLIEHRIAVLHRRISHGGRGTCRSSGSVCIGCAKKCRRRSIQCQEGK